jgi:CDP-glycerol glycerophosphotransferase (TagB/SpsB family)
MAIKLTVCRGMNVIVTGYPGIDLFFDKEYKPKDSWKIKDRKVKRIIWAPHHTLYGDKTFSGYSNFRNLYQVMIDIAHEFQDEIQIVFNPHPVLKPKLYLEPDWGKEKTDNYYEQWNNLINGQLNEYGYADLFLTSDAMILDCVSFLTEYLCVNKPSLYLMRDPNLMDRFNEFGKMAIKFHYHGIDADDIRNFINKRVIGGVDELKNERENFIRMHLVPPDNNTASENIYKYLIDQLKFYKNKEWQNNH